MGQADALPKILAGPILRRAEEDRVCVWIATSFDPSPGLELFIFDAPQLYPEERISGTSECKTIRAGVNLYFSLVCAYPDSTPPRKKKFPKDKLLAYELWFTIVHPPGVSEKVELKNLIDSYGDLVYPDVRKPSFYLQSAGPLILLHGSCRKPDGRGTDALTAADTLIGQYARDLAKRPCALFLTGDQIYANNVHPETLHQVHRFLPQLMGYDERIVAKVLWLPFTSPLSALSDIRKESKRSTYAKEAGFDADQWPLFGLGEMLALYMLSWNTALWKSFSAYAVSRNNSGGLDDIMNYKLEVERIENFIVGMPAVQRALANIPTYMIFDDHEVTDDWNLHKEWKEAVWISDLGRRVVTNALVAYWLCQGWGNDPSRFDPAFETMVRDYCDLLRTNSAKVDVATHSSYDKYDNFFWNFHNWGFIAPTTPPVFFLDTRTQRELYPQGRAPRLLSPQAWQAFLNESNVKGAAGFGSRMAKVTLKQGDPLLIVVPTPVFGMLFTEAVDKQEFLEKGAEDADFEHWRFNQEAHYEFIKGLISHFNPRYCVFFSGDVHASFTAEVNYMLSPSAVTADPARLRNDLRNATRFYQFTSSPLKNENHNFGAQVDAVGFAGSEGLKIARGIEMWESWDLSGYHKSQRKRVINSLRTDDRGLLIHGPAGIARSLYIFSMDGLAPHDPFVTMTSLVAKELQDLDMGRPLWREIGKYFRYIREDSDDAPFYPYNNIGLVKITNEEISHVLCTVMTPQRRLMPTVKRIPSKLPPLPSWRRQNRVSPR